MMNLLGHPRLTLALAGILAVCAAGVVAAMLLLAHPASAQTNEPPKLIVKPTTLNVSEEGTATYRVYFDKNPAEFGNVGCNETLWVFVRGTANTGITVESTAQLKTGNSRCGGSYDGNWDSPQAMIVTAGEDEDDQDNLGVRLTHEVVNDTGDTIISPMEDNSITVNIFDVDDVTGPTVSIAPPSRGMVNEGRPAAFTLVRSGDTANELSVNVRVSDPGSVVSDDAPSSVTFEVGADTATLTVETENDTVVKDNSVITATITAPSRYQIAGARSASVIVRDNDTAEFGLLVTHNSITEGEDSTVTVSITNGVTFAEDQTITLDFTGSTAGAEDYNVSSDTLTLRTGQSESTAATITAVDDDDNEPRETIMVTARHGSTTTDPETITIEASDTGAPITVSYGASTYSEEEGDPITVEVNLSSQATSTVTVPITISGNAEADDYTITGLTGSNELVFNAGDDSKSFTITTTADSDTEDETINLGFGTLTGVEAGSPSGATVTISDGSPPPTTPTPTPTTTPGPNPPSPTNNGGGGGGGGGGANRRPNIEGPVNPSYQENGTGPVATYTANDPDDDAISWDIQIVGREDGDKFTISGDGSLSFKESPDYEDPAGFRGNTYRVRIRATDDGSPSRTDTLRVDVQVTNINEVGPVTGDAAISLDEDHNSPIAQYQAEDPEGDTVTWSLSGPDASGFEIDQEGSLTLAGTGDLDTTGSSAGTNVYSLTVTATDDGSPAASAQIEVAVTVGSADQGPVGSGTSGVDVRISAQRLADGSIEFALQQQDRNGEWGERMLPSARFLPSDAATGQWLNSSPLTVIEGDPGLVLRISAQRLADGSVEFALQQQDSNGEWGERMLPTARFLPSDAATGTWSNSSSLTVLEDDPSLVVRIAAQRLADGRVEFALQQQDSNGEWGERMLPSARFFPSGAAAGTWLNSSQLTILEGDPSLVIRITAQLLADGRVEFALQQQDTSGEWGERLLPSARFLPSDAEANQWLSSTAVTLTPATTSIPGESGG